MRALFTKYIYPILLGLTKRIIDTAVLFTISNYFLDIIHSKLKPLERFSVVIIAEAWYLKFMVAQNMFRMCEGKKTYLLKNKMPEAYQITLRSYRVLSYHLIN